MKQITKHKTPALRALFAKARPGRCYCGRPIRQDGYPAQTKCKSRRCVRAYFQAYWRDHPRPSALRDIEGWLYDPKNPGKVRITLSCGHSLVRVKSSLRAGRKQCPTCRARMNPERRAG